MGRNNDWTSAGQMYDPIIAGPVTLPDDEHCLNCRSECTCVELERGWCALCRYGYRAKYERMVRHGA